MAEPLSLYLHIPFCRYRCYYCDFNTYTGLDGLIPPYVAALRREIAAWAAQLGGRYIVTTLYFGGGTPSLLRPQQLASILEACRAFPCLPEPEISLEANPGTVDEGSLRALRSLGVNRLSLGVQVFDDALLGRLGRFHSVHDSLVAYASARAASFDKVNLDLIYALPDQSLSHWRRTLERALALEPEHLSLYALTIEEGTPFGRWAQSGKLSLPHPDLAATMYELALERLAAQGYHHYEISNWCRPGHACRHNLTYWRNLPYLGFGAGAHSFFAHHRFSNLRHPLAYSELLLGNAAHPWDGAFPAQGLSSKPGPAGAARPAPPPWHALSPLPILDSLEAIPFPLEMAETLMLGLRLREGVALEAFRARFGRDLLESFGEHLAEPLAWGLLELTAGRLRLTQRGLLLSNEVFWRLFAAPVADSLPSVC